MKIAENGGHYIIDIRTEIVCTDSTTVKVHPDSAGARTSVAQKGAYNKDLSGFHVCQSALAFHLSLENNHDAPEGRILLQNIYSDDKHYLLMDRAYEDNATC